MNPLTRCLVRHAHAVARESGARVVVLYADVMEADEALADLVGDVGFRTLLVSRREPLHVPEGWGEQCAVIRVPDVALTRVGQVKLAILMAAVEGHVGAGDRVVCLTGLPGSSALDSMLVLDLGQELELFSAGSTEPLPADIRAPVFERLVRLATELSLEGREGRPVGALFVLGDEQAVLARSRQLVINPFHGYPEAERNVLDPALEETIKEFSSLDGAFVVRGDGVLLAAARYLSPSDRPIERLSGGLGARHEAAAGITAATGAIAICISQSTGTISILRSGKLVTDIPKPRSRSADGL
ncbi:MAG: hypothetical protein KatS3mg108_1944 [Isosphaeraceae bacterium]|jgi:hypothetical protein|nr:MAG: hypothetical protein KatS3mg108_1944 [Isosphaeraceae bacterium]